MKKFTNFYLIILILLSFSFTNNSFAQLKDWQRLGSKKVQFRIDRDVIQVGAAEGGFTKLKIQVTGGNLNMHRIVVEYGNGAKDEIEVRHQFTRGTGSRVLDLRGKGRIIKDITFWYDTKNISRRRATVHVFGKKA